MNGSDEAIESGVVNANGVTGAGDRETEISEANGTDAADSSDAELASGEANPGSTNLSGQKRGPPFLAGTVT